MPEDVTRTLAAFTPTGVDRDAVLFAAGRASAPRRWGGWKWLAVALLVSNAVCLSVLFWPKPVAPPLPVVVSDPPPVVEPSEPYRPDPSSYIALRQGWGAPPATDAGGTPAPPSAPLTPRSLSDPRFN